MVRGAQAAGGQLCFKKRLCVFVCGSFYLLFNDPVLWFVREEINTLNTLSRQASFRRMNSISTDARGTVRPPVIPHAELSPPLQRHHIILLPDEICSTADLSPGPQIDESIPLRVEGTIRTSMSSLGVSPRISLSLHAGPGPGTKALLIRCQTAKF